MKIAIIDYGMGNLRSVQKAFEKINIDSVITSNIQEIQNADKIVLPGVGAFKDAMKNLNALGLIDILHQEVIVNKKHFLGICLGMQLLGETSEEFGEAKGLGWVTAEVLKFPSTTLKIPHVGWNNVHYPIDSKLFKDVPNNIDFYFVHSYYFQEQEVCITSSCEYILNFTCAIEKDNIFAVQFHPEKSQTYGLKLLKNFATL